MTENKSHIFSSKILLFGEYVIICGGKALSIPFDEYFGYFSYDKTPDKVSPELVNNFIAYLKSNKNLKELYIAKFEKELEEGLSFVSNIPVGYGLGSSGSLAAAIYYRYANSRIPRSTNDIKDISFLKSLFAEIESFFHGKSSGLDPLISYLSEPLLVESKEVIKKVKLPVKNNDESAVFLIDSGISGDTGPLVNGFIENCKKHEFKKIIEEKVIPANNKCIHSFLSGDMHKTVENVKTLSSYTLEHFDKMIPQTVSEYWKTGLETGDYYLKLCGSGGGGMVLGFTHDFSKTKTLLKNFNPKKIL